MGKSKIIGRATKKRIFNSNVKAVLLHASESWTFTHRTTNRLQVFINECLHRIVNVHWPDKISNNDLWTKLIRNQYRNRLKRNELALTFTTKKWQQHCQTSSAVDTTRTQKKRTTKEYLEKRSGVRIGDSRIQAQLEEDGSGGSRQN